MSNQKRAVISKPVNRVRDKARPMAKNELAKLLSMAEATASELGEAYEDAVGEAARKLARLASAAKQAGGDDRRQLLGEISDLCFELRGEGASFGFDVVSQVADSLYRMTDRNDALSSLAMKVVEMHALALNALLSGGARSAADDAVAAQILAALAAAKKKAA